MEILEIPAQDVRLSGRAAAALAESRPVAVTRYGRRSHVVLSARQFALVEPLLELLEDGFAIPVENRMTHADLELERWLAEDRDPTVGELALIDELLGEDAAA